MFDDNSLVAKPIKATRENKDRFRDWLENRGIDGGTDPRESVKLALNMSPDSIFMLSDGEFVGERGRKKQKTLDIAKKYFSKKTQIKINAIAFEDRNSQSNMKELADASGGQFRFVKIKDAVGSLIESPDEMHRLRAIEHLLAKQELDWPARKDLLIEKLIPLLSSESKAVKRATTFLLNRATFRAFESEVATTNNQQATSREYAESIPIWIHHIELTDQTYPVRNNPFHDLNFATLDSPTYLAYLNSLSHKELAEYFNDVDVQQLKIIDLLCFARRLAYFHEPNGTYQTKALMEIALKRLNDPTGQPMIMTNTKQGILKSELAFNRVLRNRAKAAKALVKEMDASPMVTDDHLAIENEVVTIYPETKEAKKLISKIGQTIPDSNSPNAN